jgi:hypothetical protein
MSGRPAERGCSKTQKRSRYLTLRLQLRGHERRSDGYQAQKRNRNRP